MIPKHEAVAGAAAGVVGTVLGFPLDTIKTRMQTSQASIFRAVSRIYAEQGLLGFYRGLASPLLSLTILNTMNFSAYTKNCQLLGITPTAAAAAPNRSEEESAPVEWRYGLAGAMVGPLAAMVSTPFELVKTKMQIGKALGIQPQNTLQMVTAIFQTMGFKGWYQGHLVNVTREMVFLSTYFLTYENSKSFFLNLFPSSSSSSNHSVVAIPVAGGVSGAMGWLISFPLDNIKSNIQTMPLPPQQLFHRKSAWQVGKELLQRRGVLGLYSGIIPSITRAMIVSASRFSAYEYVLHLFQAEE